MNQPDSITFRVISKVRELGEASVQDLSPYFPITNNNIGDILRGAKKHGAYGVFIRRTVTGPGTRGVGMNVWAIDEAKYRAYMTEFALNRRKQAMAALNKIKARQAILDAEQHVRKPWTGPILTRWQPASPYYQEAA